MRGVGKKSAGTYGMFTLPVGYRPFNTLNIHDVSTPLSGGSTIQILANGSVNHTNIAEAWVNFDIVRFGVS